MADGSIKIVTRLDNTNIKKDLKEMEQACERTAKNIEKTNAEISIVSHGQSDKETVNPKWGTVKDDKSMAKAQARMSELNIKMKESDAYLDEQLPKATTDDQARMLIELEEEQVKELRAEYEHLSKEVKNYENAKKEASQQKFEDDLRSAAEAQAKAQAKAEAEALQGANAQLNTNMANADFISGIQSAQEYNEILKITKKRMQQIEIEAQRVAAEKGVDVQSLLQANSEYRKLDGRLQELIKHQDEFKGVSKQSFAGASSMADSVSNSLKKGLNTLKRYTLAVFGARSAFMAVKQIMSSYISTNEQLQGTINGIKGALGEALAPAIERVVYYAQLAIGYVAAFIKALTGVDIVARYNAKALAKQTTATKQLTKAQKENQLAGFDEMNKLSDTSDAGVGSVGGSVGGISGGGLLDIPPLNEETLKSIQKFADKLKNAWNWVKENKEELIIMAGAVATAFAIGAIASWIKELGGAGKALGLLKGKLSAVAGGLMIGAGAFLITDAIKDIIKNGPNAKNIIELIAGAVTAVTGVIMLCNKEILKKSAAWIEAHKSILLVVAGITLLVGGVLDFIKNGPTMKNTILIIGGAIAVAVGMATAGISVVVSAIVGAGAAIAAFTAAILLEKPAIMSTKEAQEALSEAKQKAADAENGYISAVDNAENSLKKLQDAEKKAGIKGKDLYKQVRAGTLDYADMTDAQKEVYKAYLDNEKKQADLKKATESLNKAKKEETLASYENQLALAKESGNYDSYKKSVIDAYKNGELSASEARDLIGKSMSEMSTDAQNAFMKDIPNDIKGGLDPKNYMTTRDKMKNWFKDTWKSCKDVFSDVGTWFKSIGAKAGDAIGTALKKVVNWLMEKIEKTINVPFRMINSAIGILNKVPGVNITKLQLISVPRLAKGGIVQNVGPGVPLIAGEAGKEAILPLDKNTEWMDVLASKMSVGSGSIVVPVYLDGKLLIKYVIDAQKKREFATNGGF